MPLPHTSPMRRLRPPRRSTLLGLIVLVAALVVAGCGGSALSPEDVLAANARVAGNGGAVGPAGTSPYSAGPGTTTGGNSAAGSGASGGGSGSGAGATSGSSGKAVGNSPVAGAGVKAASCAGFKNQTGITDSTIRIGNSSDVSGPVPGMFKSAQQATSAYVSYFNATHPDGLCGRKLALDSLDSRTDAGADQQNYVKMCGQDFAAVGSMSGFDSGGASAAQSCGIPDIRSTSVTSARNRCSTCFSAQSTGEHEYENEAFDFYVQHYPSAVKKAALLYINAGAGVENAHSIQSVAEKRGYKWIYVSPIDIAEFNYGSYVQQMKSKGVQYVQLVGAPSYHVRLAQAMQQANFKPQVLAFDSSGYDPLMLQPGSATAGAYVFLAFTPFDESQPELNLYRQWLAQVSPGAKPDLYGLFAWSAAKLFVEKVLGLGGKLTRASLAASMRSVHAWTADGLHSPMDVGGKHPPQCLRFVQIKDSKFVPVYGTKYVCHGYSKA